MPNTYGLNKSKHFRQSYYTDCLMGQDLNGGYIITAEKDGDTWIVFCDDHEPEDLHESYPDTYPLEGFDTLQDAAKFIWEFVDDFYGLWKENNQAGSDDQSTEDSTMLNLMLHNQPLKTLVFLRDELIDNYNNDRLPQYVRDRYPDMMSAYDQAIVIKEQCPDLSPVECAMIANTLDNKQQCPDLSVDTTATRFIDSDPDSDLSCDLYQIVFPDSYVNWLNSGLSRSEFVEKTYYAS